MHEINAQCYVELYEKIYIHDLNRYKNGVQQLNAQRLAPAELTTNRKSSFIRRKMVKNSRKNNTQVVSEWWKPKHSRGIDRLDQGHSILKSLDKK